MEEPGRLQSMGLLRVGHDWATSLSHTGEGNGNPFECSCLENPRDGEAWWTAVYEVAQSRTRLKQLSSNPIRSVIAVLVIMITITKSILAAEWREDCGIGVGVFMRKSAYAHPCKCRGVRRGELSGSGMVQVRNTVAWTSNGGELDLTKNWTTKVKLIGLGEMLVMERGEFFWVFQLVRPSGG